MFYCEKCATAKDWPHSFATSHGRCEICSEVAVCFDVPSSLLPRPKSVVIYKGANYTACAMRDGSLIVTRNRPSKYLNRGAMLKPSSEATDWIEAIKTAIDDSEANALCRAIVNSSY